MGYYTQIDKKKSSNFVNLFINKSLSKEIFYLKVIVIITFVFQCICDY